MMQLKLEMLPLFWHFQILTANEEYKFNKPNDLAADEINHLDYGVAGEPKPHCGAFRLSFQ